MKLLIYADNRSRILLPEKTVNFKYVLVFLWVGFRSEILMVLDQFRDEVTVDAEDVAEATDDVDEEGCGFVFV
jgi:hypothetical protein